MATITQPQAPIAPAPKRWTVSQFHRLWEEGYFDGRKAILLNGTVIETPIPGPLHNKGVGKVDYALKRIFLSGYWVRVQLPLELNLWVDPVPDLAVVPGAPDDYDVNPSTAQLVVEVSDTTLALDLGDKALLYAAAGIPDYWVLDLGNRLLHVHRDSQQDATSISGFRFRRIDRINDTGSIAPLALPGMIIDVKDLLPRV
jgi:Uma2 family endonuclease